MTKTTPAQTRYPDVPRPGDHDFTSFPKTLAEDVVHYSIHIISTDASTSTPAIRSRLLQIQRAAKDLTKKLLSEYIWQREPFALELTQPSVGPKQPLHLFGSTSFGDSIEDEWLIVYLLRELSKQFEDAWNRVHDADGEFLLVEAANVLPKWLKPEVAENRVWLHRGMLRIIPRQSKGTGGKSSKPAPRELTLEQALDFIGNSPEELIHSPIVQEEAFFRLRNYPSQIKLSLHRARVTIPRNLAYILHRTPTTISAAIEAFYLRDPISLRPLQAKDTSNLRFPPKDFVTTSVRFTRVGYAQLKSQEFEPPVTWAKTWPRTGDPAVLTRRESGMKLACAFEMLVADPQNRDKRAVREIDVLLEDIETGEDELPTDAEVAKWPQDEDDEAWLDVNFEDFERELGGKGGRGNKSGKGGKENDFGFRGDTAAQENLRRMVEKFESFLNDDGTGAEGAEMEDEMDEDEDDDDEEDGDEEDSEGEAGSGEDEHGSFDEEEFEKMMRQQMMGISLDDESAPDMSSKGRIVELDSDEEEDEEGLKKVMASMEAELKESGALDLEVPKDKKLKGRQGEEEADDFDDEQYLLAKNLLEAFKGQAGMAGPAGNILSSLGLRLPRDERDEEVD